MRVVSWEEVGFDTRLKPRGALVWDPRALLLGLLHVVLRIFASISFANIGFGAELVKAHVHILGQYPPHVFSCLTTCLAKVGMVSLQQAPDLG